MPKGNVVRNGIRKCTKCNLEKTIDEFVMASRRKLGILSWCKACDRVWRSNYRIKNKEKFRARGMAWRQKNRKAVKDYWRNWATKNRNHINEWNRVQRQKLKTNILEYYGNKCECCGENRVPFLAIDHKQGGGGKQRKQIGAGNFLKWIIRNNYPDNLRILCHNCNCALAFYGNCPHNKL